jgi:hypothetical protein
MDWQAEQNIIWRHKRQSRWWDWPRATRSRPCPVCEKTRCQVAPNGHEVVCIRTVTHAGAWTHEGEAKDHRHHFTEARHRASIIEDATRELEATKRTYGYRISAPAVAAPAPRRQAPARANLKDWGEQSTKFRAAVTNQLDLLADELGLPSSCLVAVGGGWRASHQQITWPHRNDTGKVIGLATRLLGTGEKGSVKGSRAGLFYQDGWDVGGPVMLVEGPTDTAAMILLGLTAIGRPSNTGGVEYLACMLRDVPPNRSIVVIGEEDEHVSKAGVEIFPGRTGAVSTASRLANVMNRPILIAFPPKDFKDVREFAASRQGVADLLAALHESTEIVRPLRTPPTLDGRASKDGERTVDEYREQMNHNIRAAVTRGGISLLRSGTGSGKSWGVFQALKDLPKKRKTLTTTPTHALCQERAEEMVAYGFQSGEVGVVPQLSPETCLNFEEAAQAQEAGFSIGQSLCPVCPFRAGCSYVSQCKAAMGRKHLVMPHERLARADGLKWLEKRKVIVVDEKPELAVAPQVRASLSEIKAVADFYRELKSAAIPPASTTSLEKWRPESWEGSRMETAIAAENCLIVAEQLIAEAAPIHRAGAHIVKMTTGSEPDWKVQQALYRIMRESGLPQPPAAAIRLVGLIVSGAATSVTVTVCGKGQRTKLVTASGAVNIKDASVLLLDGTGDAARVQDLLGGVEVRDITPAGQIKQIHSLEQIPLPVAKRTSPSRVCQIITALMECEPGEIFGVICHKSQADKIFKPGGLLPEYLRCRIGKWAYFNEGPDRGSNLWHKQCTRLLVIGSPRRPPHAIRAELAARGSEAANELDGHYGACAWLGTTVDGEEKEFRGSAYADEAWRLAHQYLTTADIRQAIGRARVTLPEGIPCLVVSDEPLGVPVREMELFVRSGEEQRVFTALVAVSAQAMKKGPSSGQVPNKYILATDPLQGPFSPSEGFRPAVPLSAVLSESSLSRRNCLRVLSRMVDAGAIHQPAKGWYSLGLPASINPGYVWGDNPPPVLPAVLAAIERLGGCGRRKEIIAAAGCTAKGFKRVQDSPALISFARGMYCVAGVGFELEGQQLVFIRNAKGNPVRLIVKEVRFLPAAGVAESAV